MREALMDTPTIEAARARIPAAVAALEEWYVRAAERVAVQSRESTTNGCLWYGRALSPLCGGGVSGVRRPVRVQPP